jgi:hypothetical protein
LETLRRLSLAKTEPGSMLLEAGIIADANVQGRRRAAAALRAGRRMAVQGESFWICGLVEFEMLASS